MEKEHFIKQMANLTPEQINKMIECKGKKPRPIEAIRLISTERITKK